MPFIQTRRCLSVLAKTRIFSPTLAAYPGFQGNAPEIAKAAAVALRQIQAAGYDGAKAGGKGRAVVVKDIGHFKAIHVPAGGAVRFDQFTIEAWSVMNAVEVWEVEALSVNGKKPVEQWLPYNTMSESDVYIVARTDWDNLEWDPKTSQKRADLPKDEVRFIEGKVLAKWTVPMVVRGKVDITDNQ